MWLIVSVSNSDTKHTILGDHEYVVGRQGCDIIIPDASVSRRQAVLTMAHYEASVVKSYITPTLTLEDVSKFGTFVNGKPARNPGGSTVTLKPNDEIKFGGSPASVFKAVYEPFVATTSCLEKAPKKSLIKVMCLLGGHLVRDWRPICDLLIMSKINVTIKVICAINNQKHIVTPQYLDDLYAHLMGKRDKPDPARYLPEVVDQEVPAGVSFHPDIRRMTLLQGLKFYFLSAVQFNKTNLAVSTAGGQPILLEDGTEEEAVTMTENKTVVVAVSREILATLSPSCQKFVKLVISVLKRKNLRMVTDPEIGWAILTCNTVDFCNARASITPDMLSYMASQSISHSIDVETSYSARFVDVKPDSRCITEVQSQAVPSEQDIKSVEAIKPEVLSSPASKQVKAEPLEDHMEVKPVEATGSIPEVSQLKEDKTSSKEISQSSERSNSKQISQSNERSNSKQISQSNERSNSKQISQSNERSNTKRVSQSNERSNSKEISQSNERSNSKEISQSNERSNSKEISQPKLGLISKLPFKSALRISESEAAVPESVQTVGDSTRNNQKTLGCNLKGSQSGDTCGTRTLIKADKTDKRRTNENDHQDETVSVFARRQDKVKAKPPVHNWDDSDDDSESRNARTSKRKHADLFSDNLEVSVSKQRKTDHNERNKQTTNSDMFILSTDIPADSKRETRATDAEENSHSPELGPKVCGNPMRGQDVVVLNEDRGCSLAKETLHLPAMARDGWLNMNAVKSKLCNHSATTHNGDAMEDEKPDMELLLGSDGKPLRNLCEVLVTDLVTRPVTSTVKSASAGSIFQRGKNFKRFKKTKHAGAGRLPVIIGGRDLEVYLGSKHKDIEDLFSTGLAQENQRQEEEQREKDLFNWDDRSRKASSKRIR